jgi:hypothetical protein
LFYIRRIHIFIVGLYKGYLFNTLKGEKMITTEFVMAVLCAPLSGKDLLNAERVNNVRILRKVEYDHYHDYTYGDSFFSMLANSPLKLMFIFGLEDVIVVSNREDQMEVQRRLARA